MLVRDIVCKNTDKFCVMCKNSGAAVFMYYDELIEKHGGDHVLECEPVASGVICDAIITLEPVLCSACDNSWHCIQRYSDEYFKYHCADYAPLLGGE